MKILPLIALATAMVFAFSAADAKRLGGGKSSGLQRDMPARTAPDSTPARPAQPPQGSQQAAPAQGAQQAAPGAAAAQPKRSWMGPIAGLAAGLGIAALMSHLGLGEAFGNFLMLALLAVAAIFLVRLLMRRFAGGQAVQRQAYAGAGAAGAGGTARSPVQVAWPPAGSAGSPQSAEPPVADTPAATPLARAFVPASFDSEGFERAAKMIFIRMQAANDSADIADLRQFTTPEMFASLQADLLERGSSAQQTEVVALTTQVVDVADEGERQIVSVRYQGQVREQAGAAPVDFDEVWHLVKPQGEGGAWRIAGIEQGH
jgi:predicted lipid-binding transport protein (Tim44 family)